MDNLYDSEGRLQGGLSALETLGQVISSNNGNNQGPETTEESNDEMEPALELPISHAHHDSSSLDSDDDMSDSEAGTSDNDAMEEIVMYDEPHTQLELSPISAEANLPPQNIPSSPNMSSLPSPPEIAAHSTVSSRVGPHSDNNRRSRSHSTSRRSSRRTNTNGDVSNLPLPIGDKLKRRFLEIDIASTLLVSDLYKQNVLDLLSTFKDLFFEFPWNNFLHSAVYDHVHQILTGNVDDGCNRELAVALFRDSLLMHRIVEGQKRNDLEA